MGQKLKNRKVLHPGEPRTYDLTQVLQVLLGSQPGLAKDTEVAS